MSAGWRCALGDHGIPGTSGIADVHGSEEGGGKEDGAREG